MKLRRDCKGNLRVLVWAALLVVRAAVVTVMLLPVTMAAAVLVNEGMR